MTDMNYKLTAAAETMASAFADYQRAAEVYFGLARRYTSSASKRVEAAAIKCDEAEDASDAACAAYEAEWMLSGAGWPSAADVMATLGTPQQR